MFITVEQAGAVTVLRVDRPPANAIDTALIGELAGALERLLADPPRALVIAGREGFFSAGADLKAVPTHGPEQHRQMVEGINRMVIAAYGLGCPVVCAVTGHAIAGGLVLAVCGDRRIASTAGRYGLTEIKVGVPYPQAALMVLRAELPAHAARDLMFSNRLTDARECLRLGLFDELTAPDDVLPRAIAVAGEMAEFPADVYARTKREVRGTELAAMREAAAADPLLAATVSSPPVPS